MNVLTIDRLVEILIEHRYRVENYTDEQNKYHKNALLNLNQMRLVSVAKNAFNIGALSEILKILLNFNPIREIESDAFFNRSGAIHLELKENNLFRIRRKTFNGLSDLNYLMMNSNKITRIHANIFRFHFEDLSELDLSYNSIPFITLGSFSGLIKLDKLNLSNNRLVEIHPNAFIELKNLKFLDLSENQLTELNSNIFQNLELLTDLNLSGNGLVKIGCNLFKNLKNLQDLRLNSNRISEIHSEALKHLKHLTTLDLSENQLKYINRQLFQATSGLENLFLENNQIRDIDSHAFYRCRNLQVLNISNNRLTNFYIVFTSISFQVLDLSLNRIDRLNADSFKTMTNIEIIRFDNNRLRKLDRKIVDISNSLTFVSLFNNHFASSILSYYNEADYNSNLNALNLIKSFGVDKIVNMFNERFNRTQQKSYCDDLETFIEQFD